MNIAIKLPNNLDEKLLTFPFLHCLEKILKDELEEDEVLNIHLISLKDHIDALNLLPFKAFYHEVESDDLKTIFSAHRACMNFKMDNIDVFISTTDSFVDASMGKNIGAKKKIGFALGKNTWFLTDKISKLGGRHFTEQVFELLRPFCENELPEIPNVNSREMPPAFADWRENPYIILNLDLKGDEVNPEWDDFFDLFVNKSFLLICSEAKPDEQKSILEEYIRKLPKKNSYKVHEHGSHIDFGRLVSYCRIFISHDSPLINMAAYCGARVFHLNTKSKIQTMGTQYFPSDVRFFSLSDPSYKQGPSLNYTKIFDELYNQIEGKEEEEESDD